MTFKRRSQDARQREQTSAPELGSDAKRAFSRRNVFRRAVGMAAIGATAGAVLTDGTRARAATAATTTEPGAIAPSVVFLSDAATISVDASAGNDFRVTIAASRTMGNPLNPVDGQKITLQVTQGGAGSSVITWGSSYEFSSGLPQPTLSTAAGQTDLLAFIYNQAKAKWLCAAFVQGFSSTVVAPPPTGTYRLFPATNGPTTPVQYSGPFMAGILFEATIGGTWFEGYWWWVCQSGQSTAAQTFALWAVYNDGSGALVPSATVTSGALVAGQWNYVPLSTPIPLSTGVCYNACTGLNGSFPDTQSQFGAGEPYGAGIVNGPLTAFSDQSGSLPAPFSMSQGVFSVAGSDPTALMPSNGNVSDNLWMDLQISTTAPSGTSYRLWPNVPKLPGSATGDNQGYTLATEFTLSQSSTLDNIWFYSASGATALPTRCAVWNTATQTVVSGTDNTTPSWNGSAGSGWVACQYSGVTLPAGTYKVAVFNGGGANWFLYTNGYWTSGSGGNGITTGPVTAPNASSATTGQGVFNSATWGFPATYGNNGANYWVDAEVTPS